MHGLHERSSSEWDYCVRSEGCTGIVMREASSACDTCYGHAEPHVRTAALERMRQTRRYDVRGTALDSALVHELLTASTDHGGDFDFQGCRFQGSIDLSDRTFPRLADFTNAVFEDTADFSRVDFVGPVYFDRTRFTCTASFEQTRFSGLAWFLQTSFQQSAIFTDTIFAGMASLHKVTTPNELTFVGASFSGRAYLEPVTASRIDLSGTVFTQRPVMDLSGHCSLDGARFDAGLELRLSGNQSSASLRRAHFGASSTVSSSGSVSVTYDLSTADITAIERRHDRSTFGQILTDGLEYSWTANRATPQVVSVQDTDVEKLSLVNVDLAHCLFAGAQNLDKLRLAGTITFARLPRRGFRSRWNWPVVWRWSRRDIVREEYLWRAELAGLTGTAVPRLGPDRDFQQMTRQFNRDQRMSDTARFWLREFAAAAPEGQQSTRSAQLITGEHLASLYRSLRKAREDAKDEPGAGDFYYGEMDARRRARGTRRGEKWLLTAYWAVSGYGQRAGRALAALLALMALLTSLLIGFGLPDSAGTERMTGTVTLTTAGAPQQVALDMVTPPLVLPPAGQRWTADRVGRAVRIVVGSVVLRDTDQRLTTAGVWTLMAGRALGPVLLALAALALRARVKR
jgi:uncharacterized protein YjbI with pentapeptide repeats